MLDSQILVDLLKQILISVRFLSHKHIELLEGLSVPGNGSSLKTTSGQPAGGDAMIARQ